MNDYTEEYTQSYSDDYITADFDYSGEWTDKDDILSTLEEETIRDNYDSETMTLIKEFR